MSTSQLIKQSFDFAQENIMKPLIKIITGSTRPGRFNIQPATWIYELAKKRTDVKVELVDLLEVNLPFLDEAIPASQNKYEKTHTKKWAKTVGETDGFVFVTPEYNHSYSPVLKNAIDFVFAEWHYKPVTYVSYGSVGGSRAVEHLRGVAAETKMYDLREQVMFPEYWNSLDENGKYNFEKHEGAATRMLDALVFWSVKMKEARKELKNR